jgi:hypothetical protein
MTLARDPAEEALIARALRAASDAGLSVIACDGGSRAELVDELRALPRTTVLLSPTPGLVPQVKCAIAAALHTGAERVLYTEPDKDAFLERDVRAFLDAADSEPQAVAVAARMPEAFETYPAIQQFTERTINELTSEIVGLAGDYSYGPLLLPRGAAEFALRAPDRLGWGWRHFVVTLAHRDGIRIVQHPGAYECPPSQRGESGAERIHRLKQLSQNIDGLVAALTVAV